MALSDIIRNGVALADSLTVSLQATVQHAAWTGQNGFGDDEHAANVARLAIVERKQKLVRNAAGEEVLSQHVISILRPISANGTSGRNEPIDVRDRFTLPDGTTGPIINVESFVDPSIGAGFYHIVYLGSRN